MAYDIFGAGSQSRLWQTLREKHGLSYSADSTLNYDNFDDVSTFSIKAIANNQNKNRALALIKDEIRQLVEKGVTTAELERARKRFMKNRAMTLSNESQYSGTLADSLYTGRDFKWVAEYDKRIMNLKVEDVNSAIRAWINPDDIVWSLAGGE